MLGGLLFEAVGRRATFYAAAVLVIANALAMLALSCAAPALQIAPRPRRPDDPSPLRQLVLLVRDRQVGVVAVGDALCKPHKPVRLYLRADARTMTVRMLKKVG